MVGNGENVAAEVEFSFLRRLGGVAMRLNLKSNAKVRNNRRQIITGQNLIEVLVLGVDITCLQIHKFVLDVFIFLLSYIVRRQKNLLK